MLLVFRVFPPFSHCKAVKSNFLHVLQRYEFEPTIYFSPSTRCFLHLLSGATHRSTHFLQPLSLLSPCQTTFLYLARVIPTSLSLPWSCQMTGLHSFASKMLPLSNHSFPPPLAPPQSKSVCFLESCACLLTVPPASCLSSYNTGST